MPVGLKNTGKWVVNTVIVSSKNQGLWSIMFFSYFMFNKAKYHCAYKSDQSDGSVTFLYLVECKYS